MTKGNGVTISVLFAPVRDRDVPVASQNKREYEIAIRHGGLRSETRNDEL